MSTSATFGQTSKLPDGVIALPGAKTGKWPAQAKPAPGAPNILVIMTDDVGFGATAPYGGPIPTPAFSALASRGLRYNEFHTTAMCSPTRASLLTGRNPQRVGMGVISEQASPYEGSTSVIPKSAGSIAQILSENGYSTAMFGKAHITPTWEQSAVGPFDRWPTGLGFQYFYGFLGADTSQWEPNLYENTRPHPVKPGPDYILDRDLADRAIGWIDEQDAIAPDRPFFMYYAPGSAHAPNHAPKEWIDKFKGQFDGGWDAMREQIFARQKAMGIIPADAKLTPRPKELPAWNSLSPEQRRLSARLMEAYAGSLAFADAQIGRVIDHLRATGQLENTMIVYIQGDNGGSGEGGLNGHIFEQTVLNRMGEEDPAYALSRIDDIGGPTTYNNYPAEWAWAMSTPFQWMKSFASHFGGTRTGMVISWPAVIKDQGTIRRQFQYVTDIMPTILEAAKITAPPTLDGVPQKKIDGASLSYTFNAPNGPSRRRTQVFELLQNMGLYHDGWFLSTTPIRMPWNLTSMGELRTTRTWELYNLTNDFSQAIDLAAKQPAKLKAMQKLFWQEAAKNDILPIHGLAGREGRPDLNGQRQTYRYVSRVDDVPQSAAPRTSGRSYSVEADIIVPQQGAGGVIAAHGGRFGGYSLYFRNGALTFCYNATEPNVYYTTAPGKIAPGAHRIGLDFVLDAAPKTPGQGGPGANVTLTVDGKVVARGRVARTMQLYVSHTEGFDIGHDSVSPVSADYTVDTSPFNGTISLVEFSVQPQPSTQSTR
jgi:arylsulfatase